MGDNNCIDLIEQGGDAVECNTDAQHFVGNGGLPNANGDMQCGAAIMDSASRYGVLSGQLMQSAWRARSSTSVYTTY